MLSRNDIAAIVVWFNPNEYFSQNVRTYSKNFKKVFIIDNSESDNCELARNVENSVYIANKANLGIAAALNIGCQKAKEAGFSWVLTMDQDTKWNENQLEQFIEQCISMTSEDDRVKSFAPCFEVERKIHHSFLGICKRKLYTFVTKKQYKEKFNPDSGYVDRVISSGNMIELATWQKIGKFNESLFIDEVDHDFCYRLREADYKIFKFRLIEIDHQTLDEDKKTFFPEWFRDSSKGNSMRLFYIFRNRMFVIKRHPNFADEYHERKKLFKLIISKCIFNKQAVKNTKILIRAHKDYKEKLLPSIPKKTNI